MRHRRSTSIHNLNADRKLTKLQRRFYRLLNHVNNLFPYSNIDSGLRIRDFVVEDLSEYWTRLDVKSSPSRRLSDLLWMKLPWAEIKKELGEIKILDIGCGKGNYGIKLYEYSDNMIDNYTGIDIYKNDNWSELKEKFSNFQFYQIKDNSISEIIPQGSNFIMTQSALEHIEADLFYFEQIKDYIISYQKSVIQVHLFPSSSCLRLFPFHGVRQYTPRTVSKITKLFKEFSHYELYRLGGKECNRLHYVFITKPIFIDKIGDLREEKTQEYEKRLFSAIKRDMMRSQKFPAFYGLIIHSYSKNKIHFFTR